MKQRLFSLLVVMLLVFSLSGVCSAEGLKVAIVTSPNDVHDGGFNEDNYNGLLEFQKAHPEATVTVIQDDSGDPASCVKTIESIVADYDAIVCVGFQFSGISEVADDNPDVKFLLVDTWPSDSSGNTVSVENIYAMMFVEEEGGFLAGVAAALTTKTNKVAVVNGIAFPTNVNYQYGFMSGVNYANRHFGTKAEIVELPSYSGTDVTGKSVGGNYIGSFIDQANGKIVGQALIREGCDVLFVAAGGAGMGVFTAAKEAKGVCVIGCDADQFNDGRNGDANVILTSSLKVMGKNNARVLGEILAGKFKGGNVLLGAKDDSVDYVRTPGRNQLTGDAIAKLDSVLALLKAGKILPASSRSGTMPDNFVGLDAE
ncbi:MAG: BMP family ABC transporter substrate-binding protein [Synergistaceae bacterium]|nr:BMP family ABC transporter substrate-binding protein [Synergistaceae bacterium]